MKVLIKSSLLALAFATVGCDDGTTSDPATVSRDALQPPTGLTTVTDDGKIELRWKGANAEDDFKGYHVFAVKKTVSELGAVAYPAAPVVDLSSGSIPRCKDNTAIFEAFGFKASEADCEGGGESSTAGSGTTLAEDENADEEDKITNIVKCLENETDTTISLPASPPNLGDQTCTVSALHDGTALENGTTYSFFVTAVSGEDKSTISWTSNFVQDTPAKPLFKGDLTVEATKVYTFAETNLKTFTAYTAAPSADSRTCTHADFADTVVGSGSQVCSINRTNQQTTFGIYVGRLGTGDYPQRVFISVPKTGAVKLQLRGPRVLDPIDNSVQASIPGDQAVDATYLSDGKLFPIYGLQVFDLEVTVGTAKHYGKVWIGQPTLETATSNTSALKVPMKIVMQPQAGNHDYLVKPDLNF